MGWFQNDTTEHRSPISWPIPLHNSPFPCSRFEMAWSSHTWSSPFKWRVTKERLHSTPLPTLATRFSSFPRSARTSRHTAQSPGSRTWSQDRPGPYWCRVSAGRGSGLDSPATTAPCGLKQHRSRNQITSTPTLTRSSTNTAPLSQGCCGCAAWVGLPNVYSRSTTQASSQTSPCTRRTSHSNRRSNSWRHPTSGIASRSSLNGWQRF